MKKNNYVTLDYKEVEKFSIIADEWWDPNGKFKPLHQFNPERIIYIKEKIIKHFKINETTSPSCLTHTAISGI